MIIDNLYFLDGVDIWKTYKIGVSDGSDDFLKIPERKDSITHDWLDEDGLDVDLSRSFFKQREVTLTCFARVSTKAEFYDIYNQLITVFRKPGLRRLSISRHGVDYFVYYKDNKAFESFNFKVISTKEIWAKFTLTLVEPKPSFASKPTFIVDEAGRFLIT